MTTILSKAPRLGTLTAIVLTLASGKVIAICTPRAAPEVESPKVYISAFVDALVVLKTAIQRLTQFKDAAAAWALIEFDATKKQRLVLTSSERDALVQRLEKTFGVLPNAKGTLSGVENSVAVLLNMLTDKGRKTHDAV